MLTVYHGSLLRITDHLLISHSTAATFVDGWVRTGDEVIIKNLEVFVVDRLKVCLIANPTCFNES